MAQTLEVVSIIYLALKSPHLELVINQGFPSSICIIFAHFWFCVIVLLFFRLKNSQYSSDNNGKESNSNDEAFVPHITCQPPSTLEVPIVRQTKQIDRSINEQLSQLSEEEWLPVNIKRTTNNDKDDVHERNRSCDY